ncbi:MAG: GNAT family N-acetyltransferase [Halobacteriota archaeon]
MYDDILVPTDGSDGSNEALRHGIDLAQKYDATVHLVYIVDEGIYGHYGGIDAIDNVEEVLEKTGQEILRVASEEVEAASLPVETHLSHSTPHEGILDTARQAGADLIVMGTEHRSADYRHMLGSVTERVIRTSSIPVHVVKAEPLEEPRVTIRSATESDVDEIRTIARRSMEASYSAFLTAEETRDAVQQWYGRDAAAALLSDPKTTLLVAEKGDELVGFSESHLIDIPSGTTGEIHWLHVDPPHRGEGVGTALFEETRTVLEDHDVDRLKAMVLTDYEAGNRFYQRRGLEYIDSLTVQVGDNTYEESVYATPLAAGKRVHPQVESRTTADDETLFINYEESEIGSEAPFFATYTSRDLETRYGWFCSNCESFDNAMDTMGRIVCNQCGNKRKATRWDAVVTE